MKKTYNLLLLFLAATLQMSAHSVKSPSGAVCLDVELDSNGAPTYQLTYKQKTAMRTSRLGLQLKDGRSLESGFREQAATQSSFDETWQPVWGESSTIRNCYNELLLELVQPANDIYMNIRFRVYDDGIGLRYEFPQKGKLNYFVVKEERTEFALPGNPTAWWIPGDYDTQEYEYTRSQVSDIPSLLRGAVTSSEGLPIAECAEAADAPLSTIAMIEADGAGFPAADQADVETVQKLWGAHRPGGALVGIGSAKGNIGHCFVAAAAASIVKVAQALHVRVLPPQIAGPHPMEMLANITSPAYLLDKARPWITGTPTLPRRAMVCANDFDGRRAAVLLEEEPEDRR